MRRRIVRHAICSAASFRYRSMVLGLFVIAVTSSTALAGAWAQETSQPPPPPPPVFPTAPPVTAAPATAPRPASTPRTTSRPRVAATTATTAAATTSSTATTTSTSTTSTTFPPVAAPAQKRTVQEIPSWMTVLLTVSVMGNLGVAGAYLNRRYRPAV